MATFEQLKAVRLILNDPAGFIDLLEVSTKSALPGNPVSQTAYLVTGGGYWATDKAEDADEEDYSPVDLRVSDDRLAAWFDTGGESNAVRRGFAAIMQHLGSERLMEENGDGAEKTKFTKLTDLLAYYKHLLADYEASIAEVALTNTGRYGTMKAVEVAGGNV